MNLWIRRSIDIADDNGHFNKLLSIYDVYTISPTQILACHIREIVNAHTNQNLQGLVKVLLELDKFPVDSIYVGFLRTEESVIAKNPRTVRRNTVRIWILPLLGLSRNELHHPSKQNVLQVALHLEP